MEFAANDPFAVIPAAQWSAHLSAAARRETNDDGQQLFRLVIRSTRQWNVRNFLRLEPFLARISL